MSVFGTILAVILIFALSVFILKNVKNIVSNIKNKKEQKFEDKNKNKEV